jgi:hypothetical protein
VDFQRMVKIYACHLFSSASHHSLTIFSLVPINPKSEIRIPHSTIAQFPLFFPLFFGSLFSGRAVEARSLQNW